MSKFEAQGKFLISGEYFILHGARGLALPSTKIKQLLDVDENGERGFSWVTYDRAESPWFNAEFDNDLEIQSTSNNKQALKLQSILVEIKSQQPLLFASGKIFKTRMNFSTEWGLGSSSTLISLISQWSRVNEYYLQKKFFGGSGYDIACANVNSPLIYQLENGNPSATKVHWDPNFKESLYFIYLGKKKDSRVAVDEFKNRNSSISIEQINSMNALTNSFIEASTLVEFQNAINSHEKFISELIGISPVKDQLFPDFQGAIKSLGGWGGDFVMAATSLKKDEVLNYFSSKGLHPIFMWDELINNFLYL